MPGADFSQVGELVRVEAAELVIGYSFDLQTNELVPKTVPNPGSGRKHSFRAWWLKGSSDEPVIMRSEITPPAAMETDDDA